MNGYLLPGHPLKSLFLIEGCEMQNQNLTDTLDRLVGLSPENQAYATRRERQKVVDATQGSEDGLFDPELPGLSLQERLYVALYASLLTPAEALAKEYTSRLLSLGADSTSLEHVQKANIHLIGNARLEAMLNFTQMLITKPVLADKLALSALPAAGLSTPEVVTLAQLISFVSYQVRMAAGLRALHALELHS